jgi:hypothetical protein
VKFPTLERIFLPFENSPAADMKIPSLEKTERPTTAAKIEGFFDKELRPATSGTLCKFNLKFVSQPLKPEKVAKIV